MSSIDCIVGRITRNYRATGNDLDDIIHNEIDHYVSTISISENIDIINEYYDDIYDAIVSHKAQNGNVDFRDKAHFYACMAYECLRVDVIDNHYDNIKREVNDEDEIEEKLDTSKLIVIASGGMLIGN
jgi:CRISPR/Cas system CMR subunit Cmr6 (Cas7 group RAMP superfamily)